MDALIRAFTDSDEYRHVMARDLQDDQAIVDLGGYRVVVQRSDPDFGADIAYWKVYEEAVRQVLRDRLGPGDVCLDVGANVGVMTFLASTLVGPSGRVIAVEPNPDNVQLLCRGILVNGCTNVEVFRSRHRTGGLCSGCPGGRTRSSWPQGFPSSRAASRSQSCSMTRSRTLRGSTW